MLSIHLSNQYGEVRITPGTDKGPLSYRKSENANSFPEIPIVTLGPGMPDNDEITEFWSDIALTPAETPGIEALRLLYGAAIEQVAVVAEVKTGSSSSTHRPLVKVKGLGDRRPLRSLGGGAVRMYGVALGLATSPNGFLLPDEAENGIPHSRQADFWKMVLQSARQNNIQVIAITHSRDTVAGFARALTELEKVEGALIRLDPGGATRCGRWNIPGKICE